MQCTCQFVQEKVCVSREQYAQVRKLVLGRLDNASPCVCMCVFFSKNVCHEQYVHVSLVARHLQWTDTPPTPRRTDTDNHTTTHQTTQTLPQPTLVEHGEHTSWRQKGFFECSARKGFFRVEISFFSRWVPFRHVHLRPTVILRECDDPRILMAQEKKEHLSSHVSVHGSGAVVATTEPGCLPEYFGTSLESGQCN